MNANNLSQLMDATEKDQQTTLRIDQKMKLATQMLYACIAIQTVTILYGVIKVFEYNTQLKTQASVMAGLDPLPVTSALAFYPSIMIVLAVLAIREMKSRTAAGWVGAVLVFLMAVPTWALPVSCVGLLAILDEVVRKRYLQEMDIQL